MKEGEGEMKMYQWMRAQMEPSLLKRWYSYIKWENVWPRAMAWNEWDRWKIITKFCRKP